MGKVEVDIDGIETSEEVDEDESLHVDIAMPTPSSSVERSHLPHMLS